MIMDEEALPLTRSWCIFELLQTLQMDMEIESFAGLLLCTSTGVLNNGDGPIDVSMQVVRRIGTMKMEDAQASVKEDKDMIDEAVLKQLGSYEEMNALIHARISNRLSP